MSNFSFTPIKSGEPPLITIPKPVLYPHELIFKLTPVRNCYIHSEGSTNSRLSISQQNLFEFFSKDNYNRSINQQYCLVYITSLRLIFIPYSRDIDNFKLSYSFSLPIKQIDKCKVETSGIDINFHLISKDYELQPSRLEICSKSKSRVIDIGSLISAIRYAHAVAKNLSSCLDKQPSSEFDLDIITNIETGYDLFYHQLDPKLQNSFGINSFPNAEEQIQEPLPSYTQSEKAVGLFFKSLGFLNQIVIRDSTYLENLQYLSEMAAPNSGFDYYYDNEMSNEFRPFLFLNSEDSNNEYGNYYYRFLAENALRYSERNIDDIVQVIYDNLHNNFGVSRSTSVIRHASLSRTILSAEQYESSMGFSNCGSADPEVNQDFRASIVTNNNNASTIILSINTEDNDETVELSSYTNNTTGNPHRRLNRVSSSEANIQDVIQFDADTRIENDTKVDEDIVPKVDSIDFDTGDAGNVTTNDSDSLNFCTAEGYSRITDFLNGSSVSVFTDEISLNDYSGKQIIEAADLDQIRFAETQKYENNRAHDSNDSFENASHPISSSTENRLGDVTPPTNVASEYSASANDKIEHSFNEAFEPPVQMSNIGLSDETKQKISKLKSIPNTDFMLNNNRFLENATDHSASTYLNHHQSESRKKADVLTNPILPTSPSTFTNFYLPSTPKNFVRFNKSSTSNTLTSPTSPKTQNSKTKQYPWSPTLSKSETTSSTLKRGKKFSPSMIAAAKIASPNIPTTNPETSKLSVADNSASKAQSDGKNASTNSKVKTLKSKKSSPSLLNSSRFTASNLNMKSLLDNFKQDNNEKDKKNKIEKDIAKPAHSNSNKNSLEDKKSPMVGPFASMRQQYQRHGASYSNSTPSSKSGTSSYHGRDFSSSSSYNNPHLTYKSSSSSMDSAPDVCRFYYEPENPYSDIVNNRVKFGKNSNSRHQKQNSKNSQRPDVNISEADVKKDSQKGSRFNVTSSQLDLSKLLFKQKEKEYLNEHELSKDRAAEPKNERKTGKHYLKHSISQMDISKFF